MSDKRVERLQLLLSTEELELIDTFRFEHRKPTRAAAIRELLKVGLVNKGINAVAGMKSSNFGVFDRGDGGHREDENT